MKRRLQFRIFTAFASVFALAALLALLLPLSPAETPPAEITDSGEKICVFVDGAVENPGLVILKTGSTAKDAVRAAKPLETAYTGDLDAYFPQSGSTVFVKTVSQQMQIAKNGAVNINIDSKQKMADRLPGIGTEYAARITAQRKKLGGFDSAEDLQLVPGIGAKRFAALRPYITVK